MVEILSRETDCSCDERYSSCDSPGLRACLIQWVPIESSAFQVYALSALMRTLTMMGTSLLSFHWKVALF